MSVQFTVHARKRMRQRGVSEEGIHLALRYGSVSHSEGRLIYRLLNRNLPRHLVRSCRDLVVVFSPNSQTIITVYRDQPLTVKKSQLMKTH